MSQVPSVVQVSAAKQAASATSITANSITINAGSAHLVLVEMEATGVNAWTCSITDANSNTYVQIGSAVVFSSNNRQLLAFVAYNCVGGASAPVATASGGNSNKWAITTIEIRGTYLAAIAAALDTGSPVTATGTSTSPAGGSATVSSGNQLVVTATSSVAAGTITCTGPTGYTIGSQILTGTTNPVLSSAYKYIASAGSENPTWTIVSANWAAMNIVFVSATLPTITFNSGTGSDTTASGSGGTNKSGSAAATTASSASVTITDAAMDLSTILLDGSAVLWVSAGSNRQFSRIINITGSVGSWTVTTQDKYNNTASGQTWAIGGTRATIDNTNSRRLFNNDFRSGWTVTLGDNGAGSLTSACALKNAAVAAESIDGPFTIQGASEATLINGNFNGNSFTIAAATDAVHLQLVNLKFTSTSATKTSVTALNLSTCALILRTCIFGDSTNKLNSAISRNSGNPSITAFDCCFQYINLSATFTISWGTNGAIQLYDCWFNNCGTATGGVLTVVNNATILRCFFTNCAGNVINFATGWSANASNLFTCTENTFDNNASGNCINFTPIGSASAQLFAMIVRNNQFTNNNVCLNSLFPQTPSASAALSRLVDWNNFYNNTQNYNNYPAGNYDTANNPGYNNPAGNDWGITLGKDTASPGSRTPGANLMSTSSFMDVGASQSNPGPIGRIVIAANTGTY